MKNYDNVHLGETTAPMSPLISNEIRLRCTVDSPPLPIFHVQGIITHRMPGWMNRSRTVWVWRYCLEYSSAN